MPSLATDRDYRLPTLLLSQQGAKSRPLGDGLTAGDSLGQGRMSVRELALHRDGPVFVPRVGRLKLRGRRCH